MKVAIIGAGPSGLVTLKYLVTAHEYFQGMDPIEVRLFEEQEDIGGTFRYRTYKDSELVSSKYLTAFSDHRFPVEAPDFATPESYLAYLEAYVERFGLRDYIECRTIISHVKKTAEGRHILTVTKAVIGDQGGIVGEEHDEWECDAVVVCSGLNVWPNEPEIPGLKELIPGLSEEGRPARLFYKLLGKEVDSFPIHSSDYKGDEYFNGARTVAVFGAGETAMDIAYQAVNHPDVTKVVMCNRDGFLIAPKITPEPIILRTWGKPYPGKRPNKPIDTTIASLFDTMYVPSLLQRGPLLWLFYDRWIKYIFFLIAGTSQGIDQWVGGLPPRRRYADAIFLVKSDKAVPYMSAGQRKGFWNAVRAFFVNVPIKDTGNRRIEVKGWPSHMDENKALHIPEPDCNEPYVVKPDRIVFATGYRTSFPFLEEGQYPSLEEAAVRGVYRDIAEGFAYIGFVRPSIGAIPPLAELQAQLWVYRYLAHRNPGLTRRRTTTLSPSPSSPEKAGLLPQPSDPSESESVIPHYELDYVLHARGSYDLFQTKRGVDHESYAYQLALDLGAAPTFWHMVKHTSWRCVYTWAMGPNFNAKFRIVGPWARPGVARRVMEGELFGVVARTGGYFFFTTYTLLPFIVFGAMSLILMGVDSVVGFVRDMGKAIGRLVMRGRNRGLGGTPDAQPVRQGKTLTAPRVVDYF
ncbi:dimethylaniline monooxygenase [Coniochaeta sp. 2T2.1]|nr:dimethylaniline monooxygenase [Coniochaeta sp. 2T2.1]